MELALEALHIVLGHDPGVDVILDRVVLRGQAEGVPAHGVEHVIALHPALPGHDVQGGVGSGMAYVEPLSRGIGEFHQGIVFGFRVIVRGLEGLLLVPDRLPFLFHLMVVVRCRHNLLLLIDPPP